MRIRTVTRTSLTRRTVLLSGTSVIGALATSHVTHPRNIEGTLAEAGRAVGVEVGSAIGSNPARSLAAVIAHECDLITPENALKPATIFPRGQFEWSEIERTYAFAHANGLKVHGHTFFWYKDPPSWGGDGAEGRSLGEVAKRYGDYVEGIMRHFPETVSWDVFNEITGTGRLLRDTFPISEFGVDFVEILMRKARGASSTAKLVINENDLECGGQDCGAKRENVLRIVEELRRRGAPLDAIGMQSHLSSYNKPSPSETLDFIRALEGMGLEVYLSEMDVNDAEFDREIRRRDEEVAEMYREFLDTVLQSKAVKRLIFWGISDSANWIANGDARRRSDSASQRPALFDRNLQKKPAYYQVIEALRAAAKR
jgi:endo-1,4-beta-xylanase